MGIPFTVPMGFLFTMTIGFLFTIALGIQLTISICRISDPFRLFCVFRAALPLFLAQLDIRSRCDLSSLTMGGGKIGARTLTQPPQQKRSFLSLKENEMMERGCGFNG